MEADLLSLFNIRNIFHWQVNSVHSFYLTIELCLTSPDRHPSSYDYFSMNEPIQRQLQMQFHIHSSGFWDKS